MIYKDKLDIYVELYWKDMIDNSLNLYQIKEIVCQISLRVNNFFAENREKEIKEITETNKLIDINDSESCPKYLIPKKKNKNQE